MSLSPVAASAAVALNTSAGSSPRSPASNSSASTPAQAAPDGLVDFPLQYPPMSSLPSPPLLTPDQPPNVSYNIDVNAMHPHVVQDGTELNPFTMAMDTTMVQNALEISALSSGTVFSQLPPVSLGSNFTPFDSVSGALEQAMAIELPSSDLPSSGSSPLMPSPVPGQVTSPSLSSVQAGAPSYGVNANANVGNTPSSLQSALTFDPAGRPLAVGVASPNSVLPIVPEPASGSSGGVGSVAFPVVSELAVKKEESPLSFGSSLFDEISKSASAAADLLRSGQGQDINRLVGDLVSKVAYVSDVMSTLSMSDNGQRLSPPRTHPSPHSMSHLPPAPPPAHSISNPSAFPTSTEYYPQPAPAPGLASIPESSQLFFTTGTTINSEQVIEIPPVQVTPRSGPSQTVPIPHPTSSTPPGESSARKRCASEIDVERPIKAMKAEPQDDILYNSNQAITPPQHAHAHTLQSPPPSRPPTPPSAQTGFVFNPVKTPPHSQYTPTSATSSTISTPLSAHSYNPAAASAPDLVAGTKVSTPVFPPLRNAWSESVVPTINGQSRHSHSLSTGSITTPSSGSSTGTTSPISHTSAGSGSSVTGTAHPSPPRFAAGVNGRINGRMTRSGSIGTLGTHPFTYTYPPSSWSENITNRGDAALGSSSTSTTARNSPEEMHDGDDGDDGDDDGGRGGGVHSAGTGSDVPQEYRAEVDRIFFEFLNKICSNLEATDSKGDPIHQTLMPKKMQRLDESPDFRPFKFRILAFTTAFLEELARQGYPEEKIPMKKIRNYLWRHPFIQRYNEDGKKAKSKGNYIWNVEARKTSSSGTNGHWEFRPFHRKLAGTPPAIAYCGLKWSWVPHIWDPQASFVNVPVHYSSPNLPSWLKWKGEELSGTPPSGSESCDIRVDAKFMLDGQEGHLSTTFHLNVAPRSAVDSGYSLPRSQSDTLLHQAPMRAAAGRAAAAANASHLQHSHTHHSTLPTLTTLSSQPSHPAFAAPSHPPPSSLPIAPVQPSPHNTSDSSEPLARVVEVLQNVAQRVTEEAVSTSHMQHQINAAPPSTPNIAASANAVANRLDDLVKQKQAVEQSLVAYDRALIGPTPPETHRLAVAAQLVVAEAAQSISPGAITPMIAIQTASVGEMSDGVQEALAVAVQRVKMHTAGNTNNLAVIEVTRSLLASKNSGAPPVAGGPMNGVVATGTAMSAGTANGMSVQAPNPYPQAFPVSGYV
ncbi:hypothetical protein V5O48_004049 [Marasmius crinis-equi]|uniref:Uncharacterized protein n=1 Tax=Marasmius crinis-equi TaxID=585013 RepID=A0ABR3FR59_9AGAR